VCFLSVDAHSLQGSLSLHLRPCQAGCHHMLPRLRPSLQGRAQWPALGWPKVAWVSISLGPGPLFSPSHRRQAPPWCSLRFVSERRAVPSLSLSVGTRGTPRPMGRAGPDWRATAPLSTVPVAASGTFNPLCRVLCILQSLYLCSIGPMLVFCLARDTPCTSNCSPKPLYSWMQAATPPATTHTQLRGGQYPSVVGHSRAFPGADGHWVALPPAPLPTASAEIHESRSQPRSPPTPLGERARHCQWDSLRDEPGIASSLAVTGAIAVACSSATE
jgi:hypothetical protein